MNHNTGLPEVVSDLCVRCGGRGARNWDGVIVCDNCPMFPVDPDWRYPDLINETSVGDGVLVRTCALQRYTRFGHCYHTFAVSTITSQMKEVCKYVSRSESVSNHQHAVTYVCARRAKLKLIGALTQSSHAKQGTESQAHCSFPSGYTPEPSEQLSLADHEEGK